MAATWTFVVCDAVGNALAELSTASGRTIQFTRNSYSEVNLTLSHEDPACEVMLNALKSGIPRLKGYRRRTSDPPGTSAELKFRGPLVGLSEDSAESSLLTATFRSPFSVLLGNGDSTGRFLGFSPVVKGTSGLPKGINAAAAVNDATAGTVAWANPSFATGAADGQDAVANNIPNGSVSEFLKTTSFGHAIPPTATILGIQVAVAGSSFTISGGGAITAYPVKSGVVQTGSGETLSFPSGSSPYAQTYTFGSSTDLWGLTWLPAEVNDPGFGIAITGSCTDGTQASWDVDAVGTLVYYEFDGLTYSSLDAGTIARLLIEQANNTQSFTGLATDPSLIQPTVIRDRVYTAAQNIGSAITDLTAVYDGFDFYETFVDGNDGIDAYFNVVAELGNARPTAKFEYGPGTLANVSSLTRGTTMPTNSIFCTGGNGLESTFIDAASVAKYGECWSHADFSTITDQGTLDAKAQALSRPDPIKTITFVPEFGLPNCPQPFDDWDLGDTASFYASRGALSEDTPLRINGFTIAIDNNGYESVTVNDPSSPEDDAELQASLIAEVVAS